MDLLTQIIRDDAADVVLADLYGCGGIADTMLFCRTASAFGLGVALHSGAESDIGQVAKLHIHAALHQDMQYAADAIYPEYVDSVLTGGRLTISDGHMAVPNSVTANSMICGTRAKPNMASAMPGSIRWRGTIEPTS
jgi:glucarate dehydratase